MALDDNHSEGLMQRKDNEDIDDDLEQFPKAGSGDAQGREYQTPPTAEQISAMGCSASNLGTLASGPPGADAGDRLERLTQTSNFDADSLARLSMSHSETYVRGAAVNVTRTLSLDQKEWELLMSRANMLLHPPAQFVAASASYSLASHSRRQEPRKFRSVIGLPMISPFSKFSLVWHMLMLVLDLTYTAFIVPITVGFDVSDTSWSWGAVCDFIAGFLIFVDFGLGFHTGYVITFNLRKRVVMEGKQVAKWYVLRGSCWVDALSTVAWISQVLLVILTLAGENQRRLASQIQIMRLLRLFRLGRLFQSILISNAGQGLIPLLGHSQKVSVTLIYFLQLLYSVAVLINLLGCFWYWIAEQQGIEGTWITAFEPYIRVYGTNGFLDAQQVRSHITKPNLYLTSVYWAITTVATIGYGDITPQTPLEEGVAIFVMVLGIIFFGVLVGSLTQLLQSASKNARRAQVFREKMDHVENWLRQRQFPPKFRRRIRDYYGQFWLRQAEENDESDLLQELPHTLRTEALWSMSRKSLTNILVFGGLPSPLQFLVASHVLPKRYPPGFDISMQGGAATKIWLLEFGKVVPVYNDIEGEVQGESFLLNGVSLLHDLNPRFQKNLRGYRTMTACGLWEWSVASLHVVSRQHPGMFEHMAGVILAWMDDNAQQEPESWPPEVHQLVEEASVKLEARCRDMEAAHLLKRSASAGDNLAQSVDHRSSPLVPRTENGAAAAEPSPGEQDAISGAGHRPKRTTVSFKETDCGREGNYELDSKSTIISPFAASHWLGREVRLDVDPPGGSVTPPTASDEKEEVVELVAATQRETDAEEREGGGGEEPTLQSIQEQLLELKLLVKRNLDDAQ